MHPGSRRCWTSPLRGLVHLTGPSGLVCSSPEYSRYSRLLGALRSGRLIVHKPLGSERASNEAAGVRRGKREKHGEERAEVPVQGNGEQGEPRADGDGP